MQSLLIRIGDDDRAALDALAGEFGLSRAAVIRRALAMLRGSGIAGDRDSQIALRELVAALTGIGTDLNRIARGLNTLGDVDAEKLGAVLVEIITLNEETRRMVRELAGRTRMQGRDLLQADGELGAGA